MVTFRVLVEQKYMPERIAKQIYQKLLGAKGVIIIPHKNPDGDALGSATALMHILQNCSIPHLVFCATDSSKKYDFIPRAKELTIDPEIWTQEHFDTVVVVDSGDLVYAGIKDYIDTHRNRITVINIDHHATNAYFGDLNLVITTAASTTEILYTFCKVNDIKIDKQLATCLLTGLVTDTGNFTNAATTIKSLSAASDLIVRGARLDVIQNLTMKDLSTNTLKLWGEVLARLQRHDEHDIVYTYITQKDLTDFNATESDIEGVANMLNIMGEGKAALVLKELDTNEVKGSFRTTRDDIDVSAIAKNLGGGGHKKAAGFTVGGTIEETLEKIWETIASIGKNNNK